MEDQSDFPGKSSNDGCTGSLEDQNVNTNELDAIFHTQSKAVILDITKAISRKLDSLAERQHNLRTELSATRQQHQQIKDQIETMRKQFLYKFNTSIPILALPPIRSVWNLETLNLIEYDPDFVELTGYSNEVLSSGQFNLHTIFPKFFQPFASEFIQTLKTNFTGDHHTGKVSQMVFILTAEAEEIPVQFDCEAHTPGYFILKANRLAFN